MGDEQFGKHTGGQDQNGTTTTGTATPPQRERYCTNCGTGIAQAAEICPECGVRQDDEDSGGEPSGRYISAFVGSIVSFFLGWIPIAGPPIGGVVAGYMRGSNTKESAISGLIANVLAAVPMMGLAALFLVLGGIGAASEGDSDVAIGLLLWAAIFVGSFVYFFALGAAGGAIGAALTSKGEP